MFEECYSECLATFPAMSYNIPRNVWRYSSEYNIPTIPRVPRIPFPVPVFLFSYIAIKTVSYLQILRCFAVPGNLFQKQPPKVFNTKSLNILQNSQESTCVEAFY